MTVIKYKVLQASIDGNSVLELPEKAIPLGIIVVPEELKIQAPRVHLPGILAGAEQAAQSIIYRNYMSFMMTYGDWAEAFPEEAALEKTGG